MKSPWRVNDITPSEGITKIDGEVLRTGLANFATSGENEQDNDHIVVRDAGAAAD